MEVVVKVSIRQPRVSGYVLFLDLNAGYSGTFIKKKTSIHIQFTLFYVHAIFQYNLQYVQNPITLFVV